MPATEKVDLSGKTVLQVVPELDVGGAEITTLEISRAIVAAGGRALIASQGGALEADIRAAGGEIVTLPVASKNPFIMWRNASKLAKLVKRERIDLIHTRSRAPGWSGWRAAKLAEVPFMTTYHSTVHTAPRAKVFYNSVLLRGAVSIANSHYTGAQIAAVYPQWCDKIRVVPRGCDVDALAPAQFDEAARVAKRAEWGVPEEAFVIICPARVTPLKGQHVLVQALGGLSGDKTPYLVLVGSAQGRDEYVDALTAQADRLGIASRLVFAGLESHMPHAYAAADMAIVPTIRPEPFGRTIIEAQAAGLPVIATDAGGYRETVKVAPIDAGGTGWLTPMGEADPLAAAIDAALARPADELRKMGDNGRAHIEANFTQTAMCNRTLNVYRELIG